MSAHDLATHPVHLDRGASAEIEPRFTGSPDWYADYVDRHAADGAGGRLVSMHAFTESWNMWEMHPFGSEVVLCTSGRLTLLQQQADGSVLQICLTAGQYAINGPGVWHTADVEEAASAVFITAGLGTEHRSR